MFYTYVLYSKNSQRLYVGRTSDLKNRVILHNTGRVRSTQAFRPWNLIYYEAYYSIHDSARRELQLKNHAAKNDLRKQLSSSLRELDAVLKRL